MNFADLSYADERGMFFAFLFDHSKCRRAELPGQLEERAKTLQLLMADASECWAYGISRTGEYYRMMAGALTQQGAKFAVAISPATVRNFSALWDGSAGERGSIVMLMERSRVRLNEIFARCSIVGLMTNPSAGHTPSALRFAHKRVEAADLVAFCFRRNACCDTMDVIAGKGRTADVFRQAYLACGG